MCKIKLLFASILFLAFQSSAFAEDVPADMTPENTAILVIDLQNDFLTGGSLAVGGAGTIYVKQINYELNLARKNGYKKIFASKDWHPAGHISFASTHGKKPFVDIAMVLIDGREQEQKLWPDHCVQGTKGAELSPELDSSLFEHIVLKGQDPNYDSYSAFQDDNGKETELAKLLEKQDVKYVLVLGVATNYCVKASARDSAKAGFTTYLVEDLSRAALDPTIPPQKAKQDVKQEIRTIPGVEVIQSTGAIFQHILGAAAAG